jgi:hypothetical protein
MKANLLMNSTNILNGYVNIDPLGFAPNKTFAPLDNLDKVIFNGEAEEIRAYNVLQYYSVSTGHKLLQHWAAKLEHGGKLCITVPNTNELLRSYINGEYSVEEINTLLFGPQLYPWQTFRSLWTLTGLAAATKASDLIISSANIGPTEIFIEVVRK